MTKTCTHTMFEILVLKFKRGPARAPNAAKMKHQLLQLKLELFWNNFAQWKN